MNMLSSFLSMRYDLFDVMIMTLVSTMVINKKWKVAIFSFITLPVIKILIEILLSK